MKVVRFDELRYGDRFKIAKGGNTFIKVLDTWPKGLNTSTYVTVEFNRNSLVWRIGG